MKVLAVLFGAAILFMVGEMYLSKACTSESWVKRYAPEVCSTLGWRPSPVLHPLETFFRR